MRPQRLNPTNLPGSARGHQPPRTHWVLLSVLLLALTVSLLVHGYTHHLYNRAEDGVEQPQGPSRQVPSAVSAGGPVISATGLPGTAQVRPRTIALTFDDGPDPVWTPKILEVLRRNDVHATFFVVGTQIAAHPEILRQIVADGHEVGVHTITHPDLGKTPAWRQSLELNGTQLLVAGATGQTTSLMRPPYSSSNDALDDDQWAALRNASAQGYLTVLTTLDSEDWRRPGVSRVVANAMPSGSEGQIVLMHDAGGDRTQTVAALEQLLPSLIGQGFTFSTVSDAVAMVSAIQPASVWSAGLGLTLITALRFVDWLMTAITWLLYVCGGLTLVRAVAVVVAGRRHRRLRTRPWGPPVTEPVSVIIPAYNESAGIAATVRSLAASDHPVEIIVVDDGSSDGTADIVAALELPAVRLIRQQNAGKPAAHNRGLAASRYALVVMLDGDTVFEPDAVRILVQPFADPAVGAVSGNAKVANRSGLLGRWQHIEYVVAFNLDRRLFDVAECMPTIPGAIGAFRREALERVGGVSDMTLAEDTDLTMALCRDGWRVVYEERAKAWTEAPASLGALWRQRYRWCYGTLQSI